MPLLTAPFSGEVVLHSLEADSPRTKSEMLEKQQVMDPKSTNVTTNG